MNPRGDKTGTDARVVRADFGAKRLPDVDARRHPESGAGFSLGPWTVRPSLNRISRGGDSIQIEPKLMELLVFLAHRPHQVVSKDEILDGVWAARFVGDSVLTRDIAVLRRLLGDNARNPRFIETIPKKGYRLIAAVTWRPDWHPAAREAQADPRPPSTDRLTAARVSRTGMVWLLIAATIFAIAGGIVARRLWPTAEPARHPSRAVPLTSFPGAEVWPALSPDGGMVAFVWNGGGDGYFHLYVKLIGSEEAIQLTEAPADDYSPAWSPDGREIAFLRMVKWGVQGQSDVLKISALGGLERRLGTIATSDRPGAAWSPGLDWSPDGRSLAVVDKVVPDEQFGIFLLSLDTGEKHRLTAPLPGTRWGDMQPAFSPDGKTLACVRQPNKIFLQPLEGGEPVLLSVEEPVEGLIVDLAWTSDASAIVFASMREREARVSLWRIPVSGGTATPLPVGEMAETLAIARQGSRLVYDRRSWHKADLWRFAGPGSQERDLPKRLISSSRPDWCAEFSPDGTRIAFASERAGTNNIWVCDADGEDCSQQTRLERTTWPRWSPDGKSIVFTVSQDGVFGSFDLHVLDVDTGLTRRLTHEAGFEQAGGWSHDGQWVYFHSLRRRGIWKIPARGGQTLQITSDGGFNPRESADGEFVYYAARQSDEPGKAVTIRRVPVGGGPVVTVMGRETTGSGPWHTNLWSLWQTSIIYVEQDDGQRFHLKRFDMETQQVTGLFSFEPQRREMMIGEPFWPSVTVSPDGRSVLLSLTESRTSDLMLVEDFR